MWQNKRSTDLEILDLGPDHYTMTEYSECLTLLGRINQWLGGFAATQRAFKRLKNMPKSILEVGCGGGYLCKKIAHWLPHATITGIDINSTAVKEAQKLFNVQKDKVSIETQDGKTLKYMDNQFDVVTTMLVCHHMNDQELVNFLKESYRICSSAVIINDLQRHFLAYASFSMIASFAFPNRLIWHDGRLSIKRGFHKQDWINILKMAGFHNGQYELRWNWAFRWTLTIKKT
ncbi:MAG: methyltransferase domain-containing protein [Parachlamydiaceae bacterium]